MTRVEIIVNQSIEADLFEAFAHHQVVKHYTKIPSAHGVGRSDPKMGDHIWPEENVVIIVYCKKKEAEQIKEAVQEVKRKFPQEGLKIFMMKS
ncbi:PG0541 family transporter-associated protein [Oceanispirochaeta sp.]|uniref:PG0541 family transporter-associated protein n=1 Tax=Oceanispirochaeta sp. TaxID=2035350 RepID=UPI00261C4E30|nr:PG0541 family transporter-associated protein [Oceanispirochaeta sp.]MDA3959016.1 hypothetical protein [Oceanispirochaeta sp.]